MLRRNLNIEDVCANNNGLLSHIDEINIPLRARNAAANVGGLYLAEIIEFPSEIFSAAPFGQRKDLLALQEVLADQGLQLESRILGRPSNPQEFRRLIEEARQKLMMSPPVRVRTRFGQVAKRKRRRAPALTPGNAQ